MCAKVLGGSHHLTIALLTSSPPPHAGSQQVTLSAQEQEALRRQLADQDLLIRAFQAENELAVARMKQQAAESQRAAAEAGAQMAELQQRLAQAQQERERQPPGTPAVDAARLQELLRLQAELDGARAAAAERERELLQQTEHLGLQREKAQQMVRELQVGIGAVGSRLCYACFPAFPTGHV